MAKLTLPLLLREAIGHLILDAMMTAGPGGVLRFYTGNQPDNPTDAVTDQVLLGTLYCSDPPAFIDNGGLFFYSISQDDSADATGVATWARYATALGDGVIDFDVTPPDDGGCITLNTVNIVQGGPIMMNGLAVFIGG